MEQIIADRRALHRIPELDRDLPETIAYVRESLAPLSCTLFSPATGSVCALFDRGKPDTIAFRADLDALPITENTGLPFASTHPGRMHACGHDGHTAILLELARRLDRKKDGKHNILLVFQPAEETTGGAKAICETGLFDRLRVKAIFGLHLWPGLEAGIIASRKGELMSCSREVKVDITGRAAHVAKASEAIDALAAGVDFYRRAMELERALPDHVFRLLKFGKLESGTVCNAISGHTRLEGTLRAFQDEVIDDLCRGLDEAAAAVEGQYGCAVRIQMSQGYPAVMNPESLYRRVRAQLPFRELDAPSMTAEDFSWYQRFLPGLFFFLGVGDTPALHSDHFSFDDEILLKGAGFFETLAELEL